MNEHFYQTMIKSAPVRFAFHRMVYDDEGKPADYVFLEVNDLFEEMTGVKARDIIGRKVTEVFPRLKKESFDWITFYGEVASGKGMKEFEQYSETLGKWFQVKAFSPEPGTFATFALDITKRVATEEEIREFNEKLKLANLELDKTLAHVKAASQVKSEFLANMSHEMRTPLNGVIGMGELAMAETDDPDMRHYLKHMINSGRGLLDMINDILDYAQMEAGHLIINKQVFCIHKVMQEMAGRFDSRAREKEIELKVSVHEQAPAFLVGDESRLKQVLINLMSNAVKFTHQGKIELSVQKVMEDGQRVHLQFRVKDTGIGIPTEEVDNLFKPFYQADGSITRQYQGTGLGLSISRQLVSLMGGSLWVESQLGEGSAFSFKVPFEAASDLLTSVDDMEEALQEIKEEAAKKETKSSGQAAFKDLIDTLEYQLITSSFIDEAVVVQLGLYLHQDPLLLNSYKALKETLAVFDYENSLLILRSIENQVREVQP